MTMADTPGELVLAWLAANPDSTAYEIARGTGLCNPPVVLSLLLAAERAGQVSRRLDQMSARWTVVT